MCTYVLVAYAVQSFSGFGDVGIGLNNAMNTDDVLTVLGEPVAGTLAASLLLLTVSVSGLSSTQTTILPTARGTLSMAVYEAIPKRFATVHPRYMTPAFGTIVMGLSALFFYLLLTFLSENALADSVASLGLAVAFYYGITAYSCVWYFRRSLFTSARNFFFRGIFPLIGALAMTWAFVISAKDMIAAGLRLYGVRLARRCVRSRCRHAGARCPVDAGLLRVRHEAVLPRRDAECQHRGQGPGRLLKAQEQQCI